MFLVFFVALCLTLLPSVLRFDNSYHDIVEIDAGAGVGNSPDAGAAFGGFVWVGVFEGDGPIFWFGGSARPDFSVEGGFVVLFGELEFERQPLGGFPVVGFGGFDVVAFEDLEFTDGGLEPEAIAGGATEAEAEFGEAFAGVGGADGGLDRVGFISAEHEAEGVEGFAGKFQEFFVAFGFDGEGAVDDEELFGHGVFGGVLEVLFEVGGRGRSVGGDEEKTAEEYRQQGAGRGQPRSGVRR